MKLITRDILHKNLVVTSLQFDANTVSEKVTSYQEINLKIDVVKEYLITQYKVKPGQKVLLIIFYWPDYISWFFALAELGLSFVIMDYPKTKETLEKYKMFGKIDYLIHDLHYPTILQEEDMTIINTNSIDEYTYLNTVSPIWADSETVLMYSTSSGTTGTPKLVINKHDFFYDLMDRNGQLYDLKEEDKCFHSKVLHHGSVSVTYFFPTLKYCRYHYHAPFRIFSNEDTLIKAWVNMIQSKKITKVMLFYDQIDYFIKYIDLGKKQHNDLTVFILSKIKPSHINTLVKDFQYEIKSIFGSIETGGPLFLPEVNINNYKTYDPNNMGRQLDDTYKLSINEQSILEVESLWHGKVCPGDKFEIVNNEWIFKGRENIYKINGRTIYLIDFIEKVESYFSLKNEIDFDLIIDQEYDKIYIRTNEPIDLDKWHNQLLEDGLDQHFTISYNLVMPRQQCLNGIKFDAEYTRIHCRNKL